MRARALIVIVLVACGAKHTDQPAGRVVRTETTIEILDPITFVGDTVELAPTSNPMLDSMAKTLTGPTDITLVEIIVYGADTSLSEQRAKAVLDQLVARGVPAARMQSSAGNDARVRVAFLVLKRGEP